MVVRDWCSEPEACKAELDKRICKRYLDNMNETGSPAQSDRDVMAMFLATNVQLVSDVLRAEESAPSQVMRAIAATRSLDLIVEDTLRALVLQARAVGHTWAEIGDLLHVSRQAAFQRFGGGRHRAPDDGTNAVPIDGAVDLAITVLRAFLDGRFEEVRAAFGEQMLAACSTELMADVRERVRSHAGEVQALGTPVVSVDAGYTIVEIPVVLEQADGIGRVVVDADHHVAGFLVRRAAAVS
jgi:hypothetical protein